MRTRITYPLLRRTLTQLYLRERRVMFALLAMADNGHKYLKRSDVLRNFRLAVYTHRQAIEEVQATMNQEREMLRTLRRARRY